VCVYVCVFRVMNPTWIRATQSKATHDRSNE
jgi:hypothetical protein